METQRTEFAFKTKFLLLLDQPDPAENDVQSLARFWDARWFDDNQSALEIALKRRKLKIVKLLYENSPVEDTNRISEILAKKIPEIPELQDILGVKAQAIEKPKADFRPTPPNTPYPSRPKDASPPPTPDVSQVSSPKTSTYSLQIDNLPEGSYITLPTVATRENSRESLPCPESPSVSVSGLRRLELSPTSQVSRISSPKTTVATRENSRESLPCPESPALSVSGLRRLEPSPTSQVSRISSTKTPAKSLQTDVFPLETSIRLPSFVSRESFKEMLQDQESSSDSRRLEPSPTSQVSKSSSGSQTQENAHIEEVHKLRLLCQNSQQKSQAAKENYCKLLQIETRAYQRGAEINIWSIFKDIFCAYFLPILYPDMTGEEIADFGQEIQKFLDSIKNVYIDNQVFFGRVQRAYDVLAETSDSEKSPPYKKCAGRAHFIMEFIKKGNSFPDGYKLDRSKLLEALKFLKEELDKDLIPRQGKEGIEKFIQENDPDPEPNAKLCCTIL